VKAFVNFYLILGALVPLELLVCLELAKLVVTFYMEADAWMKEPDYAAKEIRGLKCQTFNLHEDLGLIENLFIDKTGTLTRNELVARSISVADKPSIITGSPGSLVAEGNQIDSLKSELDNRSPSHKRLFFVALNICHTCRAEKHQKYSGANMDELCLLTLTKDLQHFGFFKRRDFDNSTWIEHPDGT